MATAIAFMVLQAVLTHQGSKTTQMRFRVFKTITHFSFDEVLCAATIAVLFRDRLSSNFGDLLF